MSVLPIQLSFPVTLASLHLSIINLSNGRLSLLLSVQTDHFNHRVMIPLDWKGRLRQPPDSSADMETVDYHCNAYFVWVLNCQPLKQRQQTRTEDTGMTRTCKRRHACDAPLGIAHVGSVGNVKGAFKSGPATSHVPLPSLPLRRKIVLQARTHCDIHSLVIAHPPTPLPLSFHPSASRISTR